MNQKNRKLIYTLIAIVTTGSMIAFVSAPASGNRSASATPLSPTSTRYPARIAASATSPATQTAAIEIEDDGERTDRSSVEVPVTVRKFSDDELKNLDILVFQDDGTVNREFFKTFGFSAEQQAAFINRWDALLKGFQAIEAYRISEPVTSDGVTRFWVSEFPKEGELFREKMLADIREVSPADAFRYIEAFGETDRRYTFADFGKYRRYYEITRSDSGWVMAEQFYAVSGDELLPIGWRNREFKTPPLRYSRMIEAR